MNINFLGKEQFLREIRLGWVCAWGVWGGERQVQGGGIVWSGGWRGWSCGGVVRVISDFPFTRKVDILGPFC